MQVCLILFVFAVICFASSDGVSTEACQSRIQDMLETIKNLEEQVDTCQSELNPAVDGVWTEWNTWSTCSATCGEGELTRSRACTNPAPENGGSDCDGETTETKACELKKCEVAGGWAEWNTWSTCSATCGEGEQTRSRNCTNPAPENGGLYCVGDASEIKYCEIESCVADDECSEWSAWSTCSATCGLGQEIRNRTCPKEGDACLDEITEIVYCEITKCPVDGGWSVYSNWSTCSATCGNGQQTRSRSCTNPATENGGNDCDGETIDSKPCNIAKCRRQCGAVPKVPNGEVITTSHSVGAVGDVLCDGRYFYFGVHANTICSPDEEWSMPDGMCKQVQFAFNVTLAKRFYFPGELFPGWAWEIYATSHNDFDIMFYNDPHFVLGVDGSISTNETFISRMPKTIYPLIPNPISKGKQFHMKITFGRSSIQVAVNGNDMLTITPLPEGIFKTVQVIISGVSFNTKLMKYLYA